MYKVHAVLGKGPEVSFNWEAGLTQRGHRLEALIISCKMVIISFLSRSFYLGLS